MIRRGLSIVEALLAVALLAASLAVVLPLLRQAQASAGAPATFRSATLAERSMLVSGLPAGPIALSAVDADRLAEGPIRLQLSPPAEGSARLHASSAMAGDRPGGWIVVDGAASPVILWRAVTIREAAEPPDGSR